jgi:hypothetical protein
MKSHRHHDGDDLMTRKRKSIDEILEGLLNNPEPERPLRGHELLSMMSLGNIEPGNYEVETPRPDGSIEIETFRVDEDGKIQDLQLSVKDPGARSRSEKGKKSTKPKGRKI